MKSTYTLVQEKHNVFSLGIYFGPPAVERSSRAQQLAQDRLEQSLFITEHFYADVVLEHVKGQECQQVPLDPESRKDLKLSLAAGLYHPRVEVRLMSLSRCFFRLLFFVVVLIKCIDHRSETQWVWQILIYFRGFLVELLEYLHAEQSWKPFILQRFGLCQRRAGSVFV